LSVADLRLAPTAMLFAAGILFGLTFSLNRIAITDGIPFIPYVFWQALGAGLLLLAVSFVFRRPPRLSPRHLLAYAVLGSVGLALPLLVLNFIAPKLPAGVVALQQTLVPMLTFAFALLLRIDKANALKLTGLGVGLAAVLVVVLPSTSLPSPDMTVWVLLSFLTPLCYAVANVLISLLRPPDSSTPALGSAILLAGALYIGLVMLGTGEWWWFEGGLGNMGDGDWALIAVTLINVAFFWLMLEIIRLAGPVFFSVQNYIVTLSGIGWGMLIHGEAHSLWIWLALALLFCGLALFIRGNLKSETYTNER
jgi:drug/metabolite transporter (DMT)-like permease